MSAYLRDSTEIIVDGGIMSIACAVSLTLNQSNGKPVTVRACI